MSEEFSIKIWDEPAERHVCVWDRKQFKWVLYSRLVGGWKEVAFNETAGNAIIARFGLKGMMWRDLEDKPPVVLRIERLRIEVESGEGELSIESDCLDPTALALAA